MDVNATGPIPVYWWNGAGGRNFGDVLSRYIVRALSGRHVVHARRSPRLVAVGSVLRLAEPGDTVWGSGLSRPSPVAKALRILAVRGPLTRQVAIEQTGSPVPEVYGDPALLLPRLLDASGIERKHKVGIVPHYVDADHEVARGLRKGGFHMIDALAPPLDVVREIVSCELVYSSSLHGLIVAEAFGVPAVWVEFGEGVVGRGFKFRDYYLASGRTPPKPLDWRRRSVGLGVTTPPDIAVPDLDALLAAFPVSTHEPLRRVRL